VLRRRYQRNVTVHARVHFLAATLVLISGCGGVSSGAKSNLRQFEQAYDRALVIETATLPVATTGVEYATKLVARGQPKPFVWTIVSGELPAGLELSSDGTLSGRPLAPTTTAFVVRVKCKTEPIPDEQGSAPHVGWRMRQLTLVVKGLALR
jgi:hypothetical protein